MQFAIYGHAAAHGIAWIRAAPRDDDDVDSRLGCKTHGMHAM